jgi:hypothetical protein
MKRVGFAVTRGRHPVYRVSDPKSVNGHACTLRRKGRSDPTMRRMVLAMVKRLPLGDAEFHSSDWRTLARRLLAAERGRHHEHGVKQIEPCGLVER